MKTAERLETRTEAAPEQGRIDWRELLVWLGVALPVVLIVGMVGLGEVIPPIVAFAVLILIGAFLARKRGRAGPILLGVLSLALVALNAPFIAAAIAVPASTVDFLLSIVSSVLALGTVIAAVGALRKGAVASAGPWAVAMSVIALIVVSVGVAAASRVLYDEPAVAEGDITLTTQNTEFAPQTITAEGGEVTVFVENKDNTLHTFTIDELGVDLQIPGKANAKVTFDAQAGRYRFVCTPHESMGMTGTLEVE